ncbi:carbonic anhydrase [Natronomonas sp. F2-12]|jgi:carbonic anhydrase|uniref:carbonic anhydrase n=1 Tax=Natronomonas aquatica TaxID=2841590 RepID=A0A9R1D6E0_9EURY|nr:carbonic anhydrase [Natronomonas aquatica]MCQ4331915.1 carbonic anhydrase [Natronomonas aquatica]
MSETTLAELLERNRRHVESLSEGYFGAVRHGQKPAVVSVCCSDSRVSQEGMWDIDTPGWLFTASNIGNQVRDTYGGERVLSGDVLYPIRHAETEVAVVVGHTGCGAVTATLEAVRTDGSGSGEGREDPPGIEARIESLRPVVEDGLADGRVSGERDVGLVDQLVEYNVDRQVAFLRADTAVPDPVTVLGFVYDFQGVYGDAEGRCYLVNHDGETDLERLYEAVPGEFRSHVGRLL